MAADTAVAPAPAADTAPVTPPPAVQTPNLQLTPTKPPLREIGRSALKSAFAAKSAEKRAEAQAAQTPATPAETPVSATETPQVDKTVAKGDTATQTAAPQTPPEKATPTPETSPQAEAKEPEAPTSSATAPVQSQTATPKEAPRELPTEYRTPEIEALKAQDPNLERTLKALWFDPTLSDVQKVQKMDRRIERTKSQAQAVQQEQTEEQALWDSEDYGTLKERNQAKRQQAELAKVGAVEATRVLAHALDIDPDDEGFLTAGAKETTPEGRARAFATWAAEQSPVLRALFTEQVDGLKSQYETTITNLKAEHEATVKSLESRHATALAAAVEEARAGEMGKSSNPPRATVKMPADVATPFRIPPKADAHAASVLSRNLLTEAFRNGKASRSA